MKSKERNRADDRDAARVNVRARCSNGERQRRAVRILWASARFSKAGKHGEAASDSMGDREIRLGAVPRHAPAWI